MPFLRPPLGTVRLLLLSGAAAAGLSACAPDLGPAASIKSPAAFETAKSFEAPSAAWPAEDWWKAYGDPQLDALVEEALQGSPDLKVAEARLRRAQSQLEMADSARRPTVTGSGSLKGTLVGTSMDLPEEARNIIPSDVQWATQVGANVSYQLDFFGKNRAAIAAATSTTEAARAETASARLQISSAVASGYAELMRLAADRAALVEAVRVRRDTAGLINERLRNGLENRGGFSQSSALAFASEADIARADASIAQARNRLAALLGKGPDRGLAIAVPTETRARAFGLPPTLAADLIGRRPDLAAARARAEAAAHRIKVAKAEFYPNVDLVGSLLVLALGPQNLFDQNLRLAQAGPAVSLPIFSGGKAEGNYRSARADYDEAVASYDGVLTTALREVADAVAAQKALAAEAVQARQALTAAEDAHRIARMRYEGGLSPLIEVLNAESSLVDRRRAVAELQARTLAADVALVRALGGGYAAPNPNPANNVAGAEPAPRG
jgi:NodT family efflux transporter outer membrane factor (OMF) lipoprotein